MSENVEFFKKRIFNNNHMILNITFAHYKLLLQLQCAGTVKFFNESKGYGFIYRRRNRKRHFVHASGINAEELTKETELAMKKKKEEKEKLLRK
jgi:cold shock CspA family protein